MANLHVKWVDGNQVYYAGTTDIFRINKDGSLLIFDDVSLIFGNDSDATIKYDETTDNKLEITCANGISLSGVLGIGDHITMTDAKNIVLNTTTGTKVGTAVGQKLGFWNVTPVIQPLSADQADQGAMTATDPSAPTAYTAHSSGGVTVTSTAATDLDTTAAALKTLRDEVATYETAISALVADVAALDTLLTAVRTALVDSGIMKGSA